MRPEVIEQDERMGKLLIRRRDGDLAEYYSNSWDILNDSEDAAREGLLECLRTERYDDPDIYWQVGPGERWLRSKNGYGTGWNQRRSDDAPGPGERVGWTFWCTPRLRRYRPDAPGLRTRPRRIT